jgi:hypothetical protein
MQFDQIKRREFITLLEARRSRCRTQPVRSSRPCQRSVTSAAGGDTRRLVAAFLRGLNKVGSVGGEM